MSKKKKKTLPKNFAELIKAGDIAALKAVFDECELDARSGFDKETALHFYGVPDELVRWLIAQGLDINVSTNTYKRTPLYCHATVGGKTVGLLLELGANVETPDYSGNTPLHAAAGSFRSDIVQTLMAHGANIHAENRMHQTPLGNALACCENANIVEMSKVAALLLDAGAKITPDMPERVRCIGKNFEFHRESFNKDLLAETEAGLTRLYELFVAKPVARRRVHDGVSPITATSTNWKKQHHELWEYLVPSQGSAKTVQGEVIRITGRVSDELYRNGGANWDNDYRKMLDALLRHFASGVSLSSEELAEAAKLAAVIRPNGEGEKESERLGELAVKWVLANPNPMPLEKPDYKR